MSGTSRRRGVTAGLVGAVALAVAALPIGPVSAGGEIGFGASPMYATTETPLVGGSYYWSIAVDQQAPARVFGVPDEAYAGLEAQPLTVRIDWGDGSPDTALDSMADPATSTEGSLSCDVRVREEDGHVVPDTAFFGYRCSVGSGHRYRSQGVFPLTFHASQPRDGGAVDTGTAGPFSQVVTNLDRGGSVTAHGRVRAPAGSGGMYDTDFGGGKLRFDLTAARPAGSAATTVSLAVSVPSMTPDYPPEDPPTGLAFSSRAALAPLWIRKTATGGEVILRRIEGTVTNTSGDAGTAWATVRIRVRQGHPTLVRISLQNSSAGFTYVDTGFPQPLPLTLDPVTDVLVRGSATIR